MFGWAAERIHRALQKAMADLRAVCRYCGSEFDLEVEDYLEVRPTANGRPAVKHSRQRKGRQRQRTGAPSEYHAHLAAGLRAKKSMAVVQREWREKKARANGAAAPAADPSEKLERDQFLAWATQPKSQGGGGLAHDEAVRRWRQRGAAVAPARETS